MNEFVECLLRAKHCSKHFTLTHRILTKALLGYYYSLNWPGFIGDRAKFWNKRLALEPSFSSISHEQCITPPHSTKASGMPMELKTCLNLKYDVDILSQYSLISRTTCDDSAFNSLIGKLLFWWGQCFHYTVAVHVYIAGMFCASGSQGEGVPPTQYYHWPHFPFSGSWIVMRFIFTWSILMIKIYFHFLFFF